MRYYEHLSYAINICTFQVKLHHIYVHIEKVIRNILPSGRMFILSRMRERQRERERERKSNVIFLNTFLSTNVIG